MHEDIRTTREIVKGFYPNASWAVQVNLMSDDQVAAIYLQRRERMTSAYKHVSVQTGLSESTVKDLFINGYEFRQELNQPDKWIHNPYGEEKT